MKPVAFDPFLHPPSPMQGIHSIEASAGTGKTYSITIVWLRMLLHEGMPVENILVSTFTKAATAEVQERLLTALNEARALCQTWPTCEGTESTKTLPKTDDPIARILHQCLSDVDFPTMCMRIEKALSDFDLAPIRTLHGLCNDIIRQHALEISINPDTEPQADLGDLEQSIIDDLVIGATNDDFIQQLGDKGLADIERIVQALAKNQDLSLEQILPNIKDTDEAFWHQQAAEAREQLLAHDDDWKCLKGPSLKACLKKRDAALAGESYEALKGKGAETLAETAPDLFAAYAHFIDVGQRAALAPLQAARRQLFERCQQMIQQRKADAGILTYDDLLVLVRDALRSAQGPDIAQAIQQRYRGVIIDECQDSDGVQIEIFQQLFCDMHASGDNHGRTRQPTEVFLVIGDPKQSIYRFRRADLASYRDLANLASAQYTMGTNYRSDGDCIKALNDLYAASPEFSSPPTIQAESRPPITYQQVDAAAPASRLCDPTGNRGAVSFLWSTQDNRSLATADLLRQSTQEIQRLLQSTSCQIVDRHTKQPRRLQANDIAILAAKHDDLLRCRP